MAGVNGNKKEGKYLKRIRKYPNQIFLPPEDGVMEGFEYFATKEYLSKPDAVNRKANMLKMITGYGGRQFAKTAKALGSNIGSMLYNLGKNFDDVEDLVIHLEEKQTFPRQSVKLIKGYPNTEIWEKLQAYAWEKHEIQVGFTEVTEDMIFEGKAIPFKYALVFVQEMNKGAFEEEPIVAAGREVVRVYNELGKATNDIANWLRSEYNIHCQANHPFGGLTDYVPLAEKAGLGKMGHDGLLIVPRFGTRHRISPIYIQDKIFEVTDTHEYDWIDDFCMSCRACERNCPTGAIYPEPIVDKENAFGIRPRARTIDREKCFTYFSITLGCSQCIRTCPFTKQPYEKIKSGWNANKDKEQYSKAKENKEENSKSVAIVGAGASGLYAAEALLAKSQTEQIDVFEKLPTPFGLVRYGVAPDHPEVKSKVFYFHDIIRNNRINYYGNVAIGQDISIDTLRKNYDAVIIATGASKGRDMNIPGEKLKGSMTAPAFVNWYNCQPEFQNLELPKKAKNISVIGMGNVSLDVSRMILKSKDSLELSVISDSALKTIKSMKTEEVHIYGRRGPLDAKFTPKELIELVELPYIEPMVDGYDFNNTITDIYNYDDMDNALINYNVFKEISQGVYKAKDRKAKKIIFHFYHSPSEITGDDWVESIVFEKTSVSDNNLLGTGQYIKKKSQLIIRSIGYKSDSIDGVPAQDTNGIISNIDGKVCEADGQPIDGFYCTGWIRRGPRGIIGTNKTDALEVVDNLLNDSYKATGSPDVIRNSIINKAVLKDKMNEILMVERLNGSRTHKRAKKFTDVDDMLNVNIPQN